MFRYVRSAATLFAIVGLLLVVGCSKEASEQPDGEAPPARGGTAAQGDGSETPPFDPATSDDLTLQWGPDDMPDRYSEPLQFLYWRVDELYRTMDLDADGRMTLEEFTGEDYNFERMDTDGDGYLVKREVIEDMKPRLNL